MKYLLYVLAVFVGVWFGSVLGRKRGASKIEMKEMRKSATKKTRNKIKNRKEAILEHVRKKGKITNDETEAMFCVSDSTAGRYLDELEKEGKLKQVGKKGRGIYYIAQ